MPTQLTLQFGIYLAQNGRLLFDKYELNFNCKCQGINRVIEFDGIPEKDKEAIMVLWEAFKLQAENHCI